MIPRLPAKILNFGKSPNAGPASKHTLQRILLSIFFCGQYGFSQAIGGKRGLTGIRGRYGRHLVGESDCSFIFSARMYFLVKMLLKKNTRSSPETRKIKH